MPQVTLSGCTPEPLANYLKALAVLRLVAEQPDVSAKGWWKDGLFHLDSCFDEEGLTTFFLERYRPSPIVGPWGHAQGFMQEVQKDQPEMR